jgi:hypothetical protein
MHLVCSACKQQEQQQQQALPAVQQKPTPASPRGRSLVGVEAVHKHLKAGIECSPCASAAFLPLQEVSLRGSVATVVLEALQLNSSTTWAPSRTIGDQTAMLCMIEETAAVAGHDDVVDRRSVF